MSQKQNSFIIGYGIVTFLGAAILGYMCYAASTDNETVTSDLKNKQSQLDQLQKAPLYPNPENVTKKRDQVDAYSAELDKLQETLISYQRPLDDAIKGDAVSTKLGKYKSQLEATAAGRGIALPAGFDVGLGRYLTGAPSGAAAPKVDYLADSVNNLLTRLFQSGITRLDSIECPKEPGGFEDNTSSIPVVEKKASKTPAKKPPVDKKKAAEPKEALPALPENSVLTRYKVRLKFTGPEKAAQDFLNELATLPKEGPFFVTNFVRVENEKKSGPPRGTTFTPGPVEQAAGATGTSTAMRDSHYILGSEKMVVYLDMDLIRFLDPSEAKEAVPVK